jgi:hypothetical protein
MGTLALAGGAGMTIIVSFLVAFLIVAVVVVVVWRLWQGPFRD